MKVLDQFSTEISSLCKTHHVKQLYAFGSVLTGNFNQKSGIDLLVAFQNIDLKDYVDNYYNFKFSLQELLQHPVDLLEESAITNPFFKQSLFNQRQLIYASRN